MIQFSRTETASGVRRVKVWEETAPCGFLVRLEGDGWRPDTLLRDHFLIDSRSSFPVSDLRVAKRLIEEAAASIEAVREYNQKLAITGIQVPLHEAIRTPPPQAEDMLDPSIRHVVNVSGGKDSTATLLLAVEKLGKERITPLFADTGNEHDLTYQYLSDLESVLGITIHRVRADFREAIMAKRNRLRAKWEKAGVPEGRIESALKNLAPTGNPFLDVCQLHGGFPTRARRFCTDELKQRPAMQFVLGLLDDESIRQVWQWIGIRRDESRRRRNAPVWREITEDIWTYAPILEWSALDCFRLAAKHGVPWNPLYELGMERVGCFPCIFEGKKGLREIALRFPEEIDRIREWERVVGSVCRKEGVTTFFPAQQVTGGRKVSLEETWKTGNIDRQVEWSMTRYGGRERDEATLIPPPSCSSHYGLCE